jgi:hypothetical protein
MTILSNTGVVAVLDCNPVWPQGFRWTRWITRVGGDVSVGEYRSCGHSPRPPVCLDANRNLASIGVAIAAGVVRQNLYRGECTLLAHVATYD